VLMERAPEVLAAPFASPQLHPSPSCGGGLQPGIASTQAGTT
jgi:hypothetical protein